MSHLTVPETVGPSANTASIATAAPPPGGTSKWVSFLRKYGPVPANDAMYDESLRRSLRRSKIAPIGLPAAYLQQLVDNFGSDDPTSVFLTGTPGDGKTYHCREVWIKFGGSADGWDAGDHVQRLALPGHELVVVKDLTENDPAVARALVAEMSEAFLDPAVPRRYLVAANHGQLRKRWAEAEQTAAVRRVRAAIDNLLVAGDARDAGVRVRLYDFATQSGARLLPQVIDAVVQHDAWAHCGPCPLRAGGAGTEPCPIWENRRRLADDAGAPLLRERLGALLEISEHNGEHFPVRQLLSLAANLILGHPGAKDGLMTCRDVPDIVKRGTAHRASVYRNALGDNLRSHDGESREIFERLSRFGIGVETSNRIDGLLVYGADDAALQPTFERYVAADPLYGGTPEFRQRQRAYLEGTTASAAEDMLEALREQRQRLFFVVGDADAEALGLWELTVYRHGGLYLDLVRRLAAGGAVPRQQVLVPLVRGLNRIFTGALVANHDELVLATSGSHSQARVARLFDGEVSVPRKRGEEVVLEHTPRGAIDLVVRFGRDAEFRPERLALTLLRFEFLLRVAHGALPSSFSAECYEDLLAFKSRLLRALERRAALDEGEAEGGDVDLRFLDVDHTGRAWMRRVGVRA